MTVHRTRPLPRGPLRGRAVVAADVIAASEAALRSFHGDGESDVDPHEGLLFWAGRRVEELTYVLTALIPSSRHRPFGVATDEAAMGEVSRTARSLGLGIVGQVHSHPGKDVRHSDGDDDLAFLPFEGTLSVVVPSYGRRGMSPLEALGVHQFQDGRFVRIEERSIEGAMVVAPSSVDLR